jgi:hypothetical protein
MECGMAEPGMLPEECIIATDLDDARVLVSGMVEGRAV